MSVVMSTWTSAACPRLGPFISAAASPCADVKSSPAFMVGALSSCGLPEQGSAANTAVIFGLRRLVVETWSFILVSKATRRGRLAEIPVSDLAAIHKHGIAAGPQIVDELLQEIDPMGHARQMRVQRNSENARLPEIGNLALEGADRVLDAQLHLGRGMLFDGVDDTVIEVEPIRDRYHISVLCLEPGRHVVDDPLADVFDTGFAQVIQSVERLRPARAHPAPGALAGKLLEYVDRLNDERAFIAFAA